MTNDFDPRDYEPGLPASAWQPPTYIELESFRRALVESLMVSGETTLARILVESSLGMIDETPDDLSKLTLDIPSAFFNEFMEDDASFVLEVERRLPAICRGHIRSWDGRLHSPHIIFRTRLSQPDPDWEEKTKALLSQGGATNQGLISELVHRRNGKELLTYHELKFASASEIRIAQELEKAGVLFFPLAVAVVSETGVGYKDRREVDFLVCQDGVFGVLEVSYHPNRFEQDAEKNAWIKQHGVLCVEHYSAESCYQRSAETVATFLGILARYKR